MTIDQQTRSCKRGMYRGIQNVQVLLLEEEEEFLNNKHLELAKMEEEILFESELRGAMNSIELAIDRMYQDINQRVCQMARTDIMISQTLPLANLEILHERKGRTLVSHVTGETVILYGCKPVEVKIHHDEKRCCKELPVWSGKNFSTQSYVQPISKRVSAGWTPQVCN